MIQLVLQAVLLAIIAVTAIPVARHALEAMSVPDAAPRLTVLEPSAPVRKKEADPSHRSALAPLASYPLTATRPLFFEGRKYPERATEKPTRSAIQHAKPPQHFKLHGVLIGRTFKRALIASGSQAPNWHSIGEGGAGWTLEAIEHNAVRVRMAGRQIVLELY